MLFFPSAGNAQQPAQADTTSPLVFKDVTVVDVMDGKLVSRQTVVIVGNRIRAVGNTGKVPVPRGAQNVDARGKYLIPGLWDMHVHVDNNADLYPRFVAHGVTGIREMAQRFPNGTESFLTWEHEIATGARVGPRGAGPSTDIGPSGIDITTPSEARIAVDSIKAAGNTFIKMHDREIDPEIYFALLAEARRIGLPVTGHTPLAVTEIEVADSGQRSVEHANEVHCWQRVPVTSFDMDSTSEGKCTAVAAAFTRNGTWFVPTLTFMEKGPNAGEDFEKMRKAVRMMYRVGLSRNLTLAGTDADDTFYGPTPGLTVQNELALLVDVGFTSLEALQTATLNPAKFFNATDSLGTVAPGKLADLVLLDADPLADIQNTAKIQAVVANGRYFNRAALDSLTVKPVAQQ